MINQDMKLGGARVLQLEWRGNFRRAVSGTPLRMSEKRLSPCAKKRSSATGEATMPEQSCGYFWSSCSFQGQTRAAKGQFHTSCASSHGADTLCPRISARRSIERQFCLHLRS